MKKWLFLIFLTVFLLVIAYQTLAPRVISALPGGM